MEATGAVEEVPETDKEEARMSYGQGGDCPPTHSNGIAP